MATYVGCNYGGLIPDLKADYVNMDLLFNTRRKTSNQTTNFRVSLAGGRVRTGAEAGTGYCGGIPVNCAEFEGFSITADEPVEVNEIYSDCLEDFTQGDMNSELNIIAKDWAIAEATGSYATMLAAGINDVTAEAAAETSAYDKVFTVVESLVENSWALEDIIVVVNDTIYMQLAKEDITCCDYNIATSEIGAKAVNKLGVKALVHLPTNIISGGVPADDTEKVDVLAYVRDLAMFTTFCEDMPEVRSITDIEYKGTVSQIIGSEFYGFGIAEVTAASVAYTEAPVALK